MKLILNIITIGLVFLFMAGAFLLLINKTFIYETYKEDVMTGEGIPISRFMYYQETNNSGSIFITPLSANYLNTYRSNYLNDLEQCYGEYYWDEDNAITITEYQVIDNSYYRSVNIAFVEDNYCSDEYILSDMWVYEYNNVSDYVDGDISQVAMNALINTVYSAVRVSDPVIDDSYEKQINLVITCSNLDGEYTLTFSDFSDSELLIVKEDSKGRQFAVYEIADVVNYLKNLG
mgnify:FL=1